MSSYKGDNIKLTIGGVELEGCSFLEFCSEPLPLPMSSDGWAGYKPGLRGTVTLEFNRKSVTWSNLKTWASNRLPRGMRAYK